MSKKTPMITESNQALFAKMSGCGVQEEINFILNTIYQMRWEFEGERKS
jgi:hypothetical protein